jgi:hypothetical protein
MISELVFPIVVYCNGCERSMVLWYDSIFTLPFEFVSELIEKHNIRACGNIISTNMSPVAKELINKNKINELHHLLSQPLDVQDFIKKIN